MLMLAVKMYNFDIHKFTQAAKNDLVWFYGISTIVGHLMPNPFLYMHIEYMISKPIM